MRKDDEQALAPDMHRPIDKQEFQEPNEGDPEARELGHMVGQTAEAQRDVFNPERPSLLEGDPQPALRDVAGAVNGPGGDSRPDLIDPSTAKFRDATEDLDETTTREHFSAPERAWADEMAHKRSDDDVVIVAVPDETLGQESQQLRHSPIKQKMPKEPCER